MIAAIQVSWHCRFRLMRLAGALCGALIVTASGYSQSGQPQVPASLNSETDALLQRVAEHQKQIESELSQYTFTDTTTLYTLDKKGRVRNQHTDVYYITPTAYEFFTLHIRHDGKNLSPRELQKQEKEIEQKMREDDKKAQKPGALHPKDRMLIADIVRKSRFTLLREEEAEGKRTMVYAFEPKAAVEQHGELGDRIAGDLRGKMWIDPNDLAVTRMEFSSASPLSLGMGFLGNIKGFDGSFDQRKVRGELWVPSHQDFVANGRQLISGFRIRQVSDFTDYLKATTDVFQQIHDPKSGADTTEIKFSGDDHE